MLKRKIGLQTKSILVLTALMFAATAAGGWLYQVAAEAILHQNDRHQADQLAGGLAVAAEPSMIRPQREALQKLVAGLLNHPDVQYVAVLDENGNPLAKAEKVNPDSRRCLPGFQPPSMYYDLRRGSDFLEIGRPLMVRDPASKQETMAGAVRLILDTRETAGILRGLHRETLMIALVTVLCMIPLGHLLVWRVMVVPIRRLAGATRQLAAGDFSVRVESRRGDEIGELARSFDLMAESLHGSQEQLRQAKDSLEREVAERTGELELTNHRLREEMAEKEDFLRAVSHDLNAPLRNIAGMAAMIAKKWADQLPREVLARLERIQFNVQAEIELIGELLELSRIRTRPQKRELVDFGQLMHEIRDAFEYELRAKRIELRIHGPMPKLYVERNRMRQVFQNLLDNAIKYMDSKPRCLIDIGYQAISDMHVFHVADNGPGIAPEEQERIFYVFRRSAAAAGVPGKGVGLALVKTVVANYDGRVWVEPRLVGGSVFYVALSARCTEAPREVAA